MLLFDQLWISISRGARASAPSRGKSRLRGFGVVLAAFLTLAQAPTRAEVAISPLRQVITREAPAAVYEITNPSRRIIEGRVGWIDLKATETGYERAAPELRAALSAAPWLSAAPASFRLEPGGKVKVTVKLRKGVAPPKGERRSHLLIETAAARTPLRKAGGSLEVDIDIGVSTPVILRGGPPRAAAHIGDTRLLRNADGLLELETHVHADGQTSAYGRIEIVMTGQSGEKLMGRVDNVAAYPDAVRRRVSVPLEVERLPPGSMQVRFIGAAEYAGTSFATRSFEIAPP